MATWKQIAALDKDAPHLSALEDSPYKVIAKAWLVPTSMSRLPINKEKFDKLQRGEIPKPQSIREWEDLADIFPRFSTFSLFMMLHRRKQGPEWANQAEAFELAYEIFTKTATNPRWAENSFKSGFIKAAGKTGFNYKGEDDLIKGMTDCMEVGTLGNTLFSNSYLLIGGGCMNDSHREGAISSLIPGSMLLGLDYEAMGFPAMVPRTTPVVVGQILDQLKYYSNPEIDLSPFMKDFKKEIEVRASRNVIIDI